jgi:8-oxo-dGTP pyrophosphatase MutT (NUDIX family)
LLAFYVYQAVLLIKSKLPNLKTKGVFIMLVRSCAGGVVFNGEKVFLLKNGKGEWVLPKGVIRNGDHSNEVALQRVKQEAGISAEIVSSAGHTSYEFFSVTRQKPVCNKIIWYIMKSLDENFKVCDNEEFSEGGYFDLEEAIKRITYSQDKSLLNLSYQKFKELA